MGPAGAVPIIMGEHSMKNIFTAASSVNLIRVLAATALGAACLASVPARADDRPEDRADKAAGTSDSSLTATTGIDYSRGDYGTPSDTEILVVPLSLRYKTGQLRLTATMPWLRIDGSSAIVGDGAGGVVIDPNAPRTVRSGFGDLTLGAAWAIPEERLGLGLDLSARVKLPTAKASRGLGTGATDVTLGAEVSKQLGAVTPFVNVGYRMPGDAPGINLHNAWTASGGASVMLGRSVLIASYDYRQATSPFSQDSQELFGAFSTPVGQRLNFTLYGSAGLSKGAPDFGVGSMIGVRF